MKCCDSRAAAVSRRPEPSRSGPERFYNLKIGIPWADMQNRLTAAEVLTHCGEHGLLEESGDACTMGVDTGADLHVVISRWVKDTRGKKREVVYIGTRQSYADLDKLMKRYNVSTCVIDALPEIHATREFAMRQAGRVFMNYFLETQRGSYDWNYGESIVRENRTEALDASRQELAGAAGRRCLFHGRLGQLVGICADQRSVGPIRLTTGRSFTSPAHRAAARRTGPPSSPDSSCPAPWDCRRS